MRVLIVTKIFPNATDPAAAPYNRQQFSGLAKRCQVDLLALVPWLPGVSLGSKAARERSRIPREEQIDGLFVRHPRVLYAPRFGRALSGPLYTASLAPYALARRGQFDLVFGSFAYPDGWAAVALGRLLGIPAAIKVHGSDINIFGTDPLLRPALRWALSRARAVVGPSQELIDRAVALGARAESASVIPNGIDKSLFFLRDRLATRRELGRPERRKSVVFIGRLDRAKGVFELLEAMRSLPEELLAQTELVLIGDGRGRKACEALVATHRLPVFFAGVQQPEEVARFIGAADLVVLPSWAEGTPNVIIEALASGRRVVASNVGGIPAVVGDPRLGELVPPRQAAPLAAAIGRALANDYDPREVADLAKFPSWDESAEALFRVLSTAARAEPH